MSRCIPLLLVFLPAVFSAWHNITLTTTYTWYNKFSTHTNESFYFSFSKCDAVYNLTTQDLSYGDSLLVRDSSGTRLSFTKPERGTTDIFRMANSHPPYIFVELRSFNSSTMKAWLTVTPRNCTGATKEASSQVYSFVTSVLISSLFTSLLNESPMV